MRSLKFRVAMFGTAWLGAIWLSSTPALSHDGHDHGAPKVPVSTTIAPRADTSSNEIEIVLVARGDVLNLYLDSFRDNQPIDGATLEIDSPAGVLKPVPAGPGTYEVKAPFLRKPGAYDLAITVTAGDVIDILSATLKIPAPPPVPVKAPEVSIFSITPAFAQAITNTVNEPATPLFVVGGAGFLLGVLVAGLLFGRRGRRAVSPTVPATAGLTVVLALLALAITTALTGEARAESAATATSAATAANDPTIVTRDVAERFPDGALFVPKPTQRILGLRTVFTELKPHRRAIELPGRVIPDPNGSGLVQSSVGGRLAPPPYGFRPIGTPVKAGDVLAIVQPPLALADSTDQQQQARELDQQISIAKRKVERLTSIKQVVARSQLEDAELELTGLKARRASLDTSKRETETLVAPVDGIIAESNAVAGRIAEPNSVVFHIVDANRLWVEALSYELQAIGETAQAVVASGANIELDYIGTGLADKNQAVPIHFAVRGDAGGLRPGQFLTVLATTSDQLTGVAVPREAVLRGSNGQNLVYEHSNAERFVAREVRVEPLDAKQVLIVAGIGADKRVVTQGAELLNQIR